MIALLQIIRQPLLLLLVLFSCSSSEYVSINSAAAFALSTQSQQGRTQHHQVVHSSNTVGAFCTQVGLPITISRSSHRLYSSRLAASSNSHDDDADHPCTLDNSIPSDCNSASLISKEQRTATIIQPPLLKSSSSSSSSSRPTACRVIFHGLDHHF
mmetsp:Transcript_5191/g.8132  ORF Transcript_5191/g.8132 Transcript_5191/m.8132 type:complete len:156 (+) Transcript_5191:147-614(+)